MTLTRAPLWLVGFRPFFLLACLSGLVLPLLWVLVLSGQAPAPRTPFSVLQWHAHEMFFGFGWAVLGGFLLTATKNWVHVRGWHGAPLVFLALAWLQERAGMWFARDLPWGLFLVSNHLFLVSVVAMLLWTLVRYRGQDTFRDNPLFVAVLPLFLAAKVLLLQPDRQAVGMAMALALFRVAFLVMLERTTTQFMKAAFQVTLPRVRWLDRSIKGLGLALVFDGFLPPQVGAWAGVALAGLVLARLATWKPHLGLRRLDIGVMYLGTLALAAQLVVEAFRRTLPQAFVGAVSVHVFTLGTMGLIIPAMVVRLAKGHTGRKVEFDRLDRAVLWVMLGAFACRVLGSQADPAHYTAWLLAAAAGWAICFATLGVRYAPFLWRPRVDGKEH